MDEDDEFDALIANMDIDQVVQQHSTQRQAQESSSTQRHGPYSTNHLRASNPVANPFETSTGVHDAPNYIGPEVYRRNQHQPGPPHDGSRGTSFGAPQQHHDGSVSSGPGTDVSVICSGHNLPCRVLTANTSRNQGRQFYKCSLPEGQQCDFFEWLDGGDNPDAGFDLGVGGEARPAGELYASFQGSLRDVARENRFKFGHASFRPGQREVIEQAMHGRDAFVLMPTGGGKSLCYQLPAWCTPGIAVVVSPLLSLIQDQVQSLLKLGVDCAFLSSSQDYQTEQREVVQRLNDVTPHGSIKLLYMTPEKLNNSQHMQSILSRLYQRSLISRFVVDEAHCLR
jgi:hypothetical protein